MSAPKGSKARFGYLAQPGSAPEAALPEVVSVPEAQKGQKEQFNIRIRTEVKRRAMSRAALEGRHVSDVVEQLLLEWLEEGRAG